MDFLKGVDSSASCSRGLPFSAATLVGTSVIATAVFFLLARRALWPARPQIISSPLTTTIPNLTPNEIKSLPYPPDEMPGARDVTSPYGSIRVYEFGPENGRKVLLIHGITTSCMTLTELAMELVEKKGCRVMCFDLFGRGFSDAVGDLPYDSRLYVTQILLALASSPLPWTGDGALTLIGYSLGGGIASSFAAAFPRLVGSLVLLAPAGLIRPRNFGLAARVVFQMGLIPDRILHWLTKRRLRTPLGESVKRGPQPPSSLKEVESEVPLTTTAVHEALPVPVIEEEEGSAFKKPNEIISNGEGKDATTSLHPTEIRAAAIVQWQLRHHPGFVRSFMSSLRYAPLMDQHATWRALGASRQPGTTAIIMGRFDELVQWRDYEEDAFPLLCGSDDVQGTDKKEAGRDKVFWRIVPGGHNFPFTNTREALDAVYEFWGLEQSR